MEEIIPFLIFVFWIVMNLIGQKRKAEKRKQREIEKQRQRDQYEPDERETHRPQNKPIPPIIFEDEQREIDILEEILGRKKPEPAPKPKPVPVAYTPKTEIRTSKFEDPASIVFKEKQIADKMKREYEQQLIEFKLNINKAFARKNVHRKKSTKGRYSRAILGSFDLKKAVIYSEILKRPY